MNKFNTEFWLPVPLEKAWEFFSSPKNLTQISPSYMGISLEGDPKTENGSVFDIKMSPFGLPVPLSWRSKIINVKQEVDSYEFQDIQEKGPFKSWSHTHRFVRGSKKIGEAAMAEPGTWFKDSVEYQVPFDVLNIADQLVFKRILAQMFSYRKKALRELLL